MKVDYIKDKEMETFSNIVVGECFRYENAYYQKIEVQLPGEDTNKPFGNHLRSGRAQEFAGRTLVEPADLLVVAAKKGLQL